jgi:excisionase family DNA binding protein
MSLLSVGEAAERLGVSSRQVQHLAAQGELRQIARGVLDEASVDHFLAVRGASGRTQAWSGPTAWGAIAILSGQVPHWMGGTQRSRLKARLRDLSSAGLVERARNRAVAVRYAGHPAGAERVRTEIVDTSRGAVSLGLATATAVDGYVAEGDLGGLLVRHGLIHDDAGRFTLRATSMDLAVVQDLAENGVVLVALDLAGSLDSRERAVGSSALDRALRRM